MRKTAIIGATLFTLPSLVFAAGPMMKDGKWKITTSMEMPGMPMKMAPQTTTRCFSKEDVQNPKKLTENNDKKNDCKMIDLKSSGNKTTWKMVCDGQNKATGSGEVTYRGDSYESLMVMKTSGGPKGTMDMKTKTVGKYLGPCK